MTTEGIIDKLRDLTASRSTRDLLPRRHGENFDLLTTWRPWKYPKGPQQKQKHFLSWDFPSHVLSKMPLQTRMATSTRFLHSHASNSSFFETWVTVPTMPTWQLWIYGLNADQPSLLKQYTGRQTRFGCMWWGTERKTTYVEIPARLV